MYTENYTEEIKCINFNQWSTRQCKQRLNEHFRIQKHRHHKHVIPYSKRKLSYQGHMVDA